MLSSHTFSDSVQADRMKNITCQRNSNDQCQSDQIYRQNQCHCRIPAISVINRIIIFEII